MFFAIQKFFCNNKIKIISRKFIISSSIISHSNSSDEIHNIIQEEEAIFKKIPIVGVPEVSKLIDSAISKREGDRRKHKFSREKKYSIKVKMDSL